MRCPSCMAENAATRRFCAQCGTPLPTPCPACGFENEPTARFCGGCGRPVGEGMAQGAISFQSSNAWDAYAASAFGMRVVWCNRYGQRPERLPGKPDREIASLEELPALVGA